jgi:hypothetical protein
MNPTRFIPNFIGPWTAGCAYQNTPSYPGFWSGNPTSSNYGNGWTSGFNPPAFAWNTPYSGFGVPGLHHGSFGSTPWGGTPWGWTPPFNYGWSNPSASWFGGFPTPYGINPGAFGGFGGGCFPSFNYGGTWNNGPTFGYPSYPTNSGGNAPSVIGPTPFGGGTPGLGNSYGTGSGGWTGFTPGPFGWTFPTFGTIPTPSFGSPFGVPTAFQYPTTGFGTFPMSYPYGQNGFNPGYAPFGSFGYGTTTPVVTPYGVGPGGQGYWPYGHNTGPFGFPGTSPNIPVGETMARANGTIGLNREAA